MKLDEPIPYSDFFSYAHGAFDGRLDPEPWFEMAGYYVDPSTGWRIRLGPSTASAAEAIINEEDLRVHGDMAPGGNIQLPRECKYCAHSLEKERIKLPSGNRGMYMATNFASVAACPACGWWKLCKYRRGEVDDPFSPQMWVAAYFFEGTVYEFENDPSLGSIATLRRSIQHRKIDLRNISPTDLELLVGAVMRDYHGCEVHHVGGPGDGGIDLLVSEGENPIAVQVKRRSSAKPAESVAVVRHLLGSMILGGYTKGLVVTTAKEYSRPAKDAAVLASRRLPVQIDLYHHEKLMDLLELTAPAVEPWRRLLTPPEASGFQLGKLREWFSKWFQ